MEIISSSDMAKNQRRRIIRDLANITIHTYDNDSLDSRIKNWDEIARTYFRVQGVTLTGDEIYFHNLITVSNLLTSIAIRESLGGNENLAVAKEQTILYRSIVNAQNKKEPEQGLNSISKTNGINNQSGTFG